jgi:hypothetical protein
MAQRQKISQMTPKGANLEATDLLEISELSGSGYITKSITGQEIIDASGGNFVPYTGATADVDLGTFHLDAGKGTFSHNGSTDTLTANHTSGAGIGLLITKGGNNEGLKVNKTSGSGNAATIIGTLEATTLVKTGGLSTQFLMADGTTSLGGGGDITIDTKTTQYTLVTGDNSKFIELNFSGGNNIIIPTNTAQPFPIGAQIILSQYGAGQVTVVADTGVTLRSSGGKTKTSAQYAMATLIKRGTNEWYLAGDITT